MAAMNSCINFFIHVTRRPAPLGLRGENIIKSQFDGLSLSLQLNQLPTVLIENGVLMSDVSRQARLSATHSYLIIILFVKLCKWRGKTCIVPKTKYCAYLSPFFTYKLPFTAPSSSVDHRPRASFRADPQFVFH
jgi:hypothetical protein